MKIKYKAIKEQNHMWKENEGSKRKEAYLKYILWE